MAIGGVTGSGNQGGAFVFKPFDGGGMEIPPPPPVEPGTLFINDTFSHQPNRFEHGDMVRDSALSMGYRGDISIWSKNSQAQSTGLEKLGSESMTGEEARDTIRQTVSENVSDFLNGQAGTLNLLRSRNPRNSVVNMSLGVCQATYAEGIYSQTFNGLNSKNPEEAERSRIMLQNQAEAFQLDPKRLVSEDPEVHGPERKKLQQGLVDLVADEFRTSPSIASGRKSFEKAVNDFESSGRNSVVIAAGNQGDYEERLEGMNHQNSIDVPSDFSQNVLETDQVTSVGATLTTRNVVTGELSEPRAEFSSDSNGVDVYADGVTRFKAADGLPVWGTSFASPRVAAVMAELHKQHPDYDSAQIEDLLKDQYTHTLKDDSRALDFDVFRRLSETTY